MKEKVSFGGEILYLGGIRVGMVKRFFFLLKSTVRNIGDQNFVNFQNDNGRTGLYMISKVIYTDIVV